MKACFSLNSCCCEYRDPPQLEDFYQNLQAILLMVGEYSKEGTTETYQYCTMLYDVKLDTELLPLYY